MATQNIYNMTDTWNAGGTTFTAIKMNVTDTASQAASLLLDLQVGGSSKFNITKAGAVAFSTGASITSISGSLDITAANGFINVGAHFVPANGSVDVGASGAKWRAGYFSDQVLAATLARTAPVTETNATHTVAATTTHLIANRAGTITVTLPTASSFPGRELIIKTIQAQTVISNASNVVPSTSASAGTAILPGTDGAWAHLVSDGTNWIIMAANPLV